MWPGLAIVHHPYQSGIVHLFPHHHALLCDELPDVSNTSLVLTRRTHATPMHTSLLGWKIGSWTELRVLTTVSQIGHGEARAHLATDARIDNLVSDVCKQTDIRVVAVNPA